MPYLGVYIATLAAELSVYSADIALVCAGKYPSTLGACRLDA